MTHREASSSRPPHVAIIGAGCAGGAMAIHLRRAGVAVTLLEAKAFPRVKVCGEFITPAAVPLLEALLPAAQLASIGAQRVHTMRLIEGGREHDLRMPAPAWALSRATLDTLLRDHAVSLGARVLQPASVRDVTFAPASVRLRTTAGDAIDADLVVHADGLGRHDPAGPTPMAPGLMAHKCHLHADAPVLAHSGGLACPPGTVAIRACAGAYVGVVHVDPHAGDKPLATCALVCRSDLTRAHGGDGDALLAALCPGFDSAQRASDWHSCGVARGRFRDSGHPRSFRIGNAAAAVDPIGGEGMGLALWSAHTLASCLLSHAQQGWNDATLGRVRDAYARSYRARLRTRAPACRVGAETLLRPALCRRARPLLPMLMGPWYRLSGKPARALPALSGTDAANRHAAIP